MRTAHDLNHFEYMLSPYVAKMAPLERVFGREVASLLDPMIEATQSISRNETVTRTQTAEFLSNILPAALRNQDIAQTSTCYEFFAAINVFRCGGHVYEIAQELTEILRDCDFKVDRQHVRPPHKAVFIRWPGAGLTVSNQLDGSVIPLDGVYVVYAHEPDLTQPCKDHMYVIVMSRADSGKPAGEYNMIWLPLEWPDTNDTVDSAGLAQSIRERFSHTPGVDLDKLVNLTVNTLLYLTLPAAEMRRVIPEAARHGLHARNPAKREKAERRVSLETSRRPYVLVGESVRNIRRAEAALKVPGGKGKPLTVRVHVSGHFKIVRYGPDLENSRVQFIEPHYRGPRTADEAAAIHVGRVIAPKETPKDVLS